MWEYSHEGKQLENKWVFRRLQKTGNPDLPVGLPHMLYIF